VSKLPVISSRDFIKYLTKEKGFDYDHTHGSHHIFKRNDRMVSVPEREEIGKGLLLSMLEEAGITREDFIRGWTKR
jgi:predicted RNA binding protein YcfA (HicA-like mRNA interferase family)